MRNPRDFQRVNRRGLRRVSAHFVAVVAPARGAATVEMAKLGLAVSRQVGNAVARNRVKRQVREWFRRSRIALPEGTDWVVIARRGAAELAAATVACELDRLATTR